jgi:hypothetical protein
VLELQFLPEDSPDCPLIRIAGADSAAYAKLHDTIVRLSTGTIRAADIDQLPAIVAIDECRVTAIAAKWDQGVIRTDDANRFEWRLTANTWDNVAALLEPFCSGDSRHGFQWIESAGDIAVLVTCDGQW